MSDHEPVRLTEDDFLDLIASFPEPDFDREDAEALAAWTSREWGPE